MNALFRLSIATLLVASLNPIIAQTPEDELLPKPSAFKAVSNGTPPPVKLQTPEVSSQSVEQRLVQSLREADNTLKDAPSIVSPTNDELINAVRALDAKAATSPTKVTPRPSPVSDQPVRRAVPVDEIRHSQKASSASNQRSESEAPNRNCDAAVTHLVAAEDELDKLASTDLLSPSIQREVKQNISNAKMLLGRVVDKEQKTVVKP